MSKAKRLREQREAERTAEMVTDRVPPDDPTRSDREVRLARARTHLEDLSKEIRGYLDAALDTVDEEPHPEVAGEDGTHQYTTWVTAHAPPREPFSVLIGEVLQGLRSTLDYLCLELAAAHTSPLSDDVVESSEFPIFGDKGGDGSARFNRLRSKGPDAGQPAPGSGLFKTRGMDSSAQEIIERLQPYHRGSAYQGDALWRIHELNRIDKHRLLHLSVGAFEGATLDPLKAKNVSGFARPGTISLAAIVDGRTEVARTFPRIINPSKEIDTGFRPYLDVLFHADTPLVGGEAVMAVLRDLYDYVLTDVLPPLVGFLK